jgi:hypothetical protein
MNLPEKEDVKLAISSKNRPLRRHYREQWLPWEDCVLLILEYCRELGFPENEVDFVKGLKSWMIEVSRNVVDSTAVGS